MSDATSLRYNKWLLAAAALLCARIFYNTWATEDAFITMRTVDNFLHGHGLTWNAGERVQAYTHPLWMFCIVVVQFVTHQPFATLYVLGWIASAAFVIILFARRDRPLLLVTLLLCLAASKAFVEFSTSGLENSLTHVLLALFVLRATSPKTSLTQLVLIASLVFVNRVDAVLLIAPWLGYLLVQRARTSPRSAITAIAIGALPAIAWELFSAFYYGALVPNTAFAKLQNGWTLAMRFVQAYHYFGALAVYDPATFIAILFCAFVIWQQLGVTRALCIIGLGVYALYLFFIGGDFMCGRFFTAPLAFATAAALFTSAGKDSSLRTVTHAAVLFVLSISYTHVMSLGRTITDVGLADERAFYPHTWLFVPDGEPPDFSDSWQRVGERLRNEHTPFYVHANIGFMGYVAGPGVYLIDRLALTDAFLSRLPARRDIPLRVGHYFRLMPHGYAASLRTGHCEMDPALCPLFDDLRLVTRAPLFAPGRLQAIKRLLTNAHAEARDPKWSIAMPEVLKQDQLPTDVEHPRILDDHGTILLFDKERFVDAFALTVDAGRCYSLSTQDFHQTYCNTEKHSPPHEQVIVPVHRLARFVDVTFDFGIPEPPLYGLESVHAATPEEKAKTP